jgi:hypothetical protein
VRLRGGSCERERWRGAFEPVVVVVVVPANQNYKMVHPAQDGGEEKGGVQVSMRFHPPIRLEVSAVKGFHFLSFCPEVSCRWLRLLYEMDLPRRRHWYGSNWIQGSSSDCVIPMEPEPLPRRISSKARVIRRTADEVGVGGSGTIRFCIRFGSVRFLELAGTPSAAEPSFI